MIDRGEVEAAAETEPESGKPERTAGIELEVG